jgi:hypothetical protein
MPQEEPLIEESEQPSNRRTRSSPDVSGGNASAGVDVKRNTRKRGDSIRARQERQLFTRRRSDMGPAVGEEVMLSDALENTRAWRESSEPRNSLDEAEHLLPPVAPQNGTDATDLDVLVAAYKESDVANSVRDEIATAIRSVPNGDAGAANGSAGSHGIGNGMKGFKRLGWWGQFAILSGRTWKNLYRNPLLMLAHYAIAITLGGKSPLIFYQYLGIC